MKTVLITGAGGNLGGTVVRRFVEDGYQVLALVLPGMKPESVSKEIEYFEIDLAKEVSVNELISLINTKSGELNAALLLAGGYEGGGIDKTDAAALQRMFDLNFETAYYIARSVFNKMMTQTEGGRIVFMGARPALDPKAGKTAIAYGLSKSLLFKLSEYLNEAGGGKVTTYVAVPSTIDTPPNRKAMPNADFSTWQTPESIAGTLATIARGEWKGENVVRLYK